MRPVDLACKYVAQERHRRGPGLWLQRVGSATGNRADVLSVSWQPEGHHR
jgi:hypothetical protein